MAAAGSTSGGVAARALICLGLCCLGPLWGCGDEDPPEAPPAQRVMGPVGEVNAANFATSEVCRPCHSNHVDAEAMRDVKNRPVAPHDLWRASLMANSARDPLWRAFVAAEQAQNPAIAEQIGRECVRCHAPMAVQQARLSGEATPTLAVVDAVGATGELARDGVSCSLCHQLPAQGLAAPHSWNGRLQPGKDRVIYGPYEQFDAHTMMKAISFQPSYGPHIHDSALCASCHTLLSEAVDEQGKGTGKVLPELTTWMAWANANPTPPGVPPHLMDNTCQHCHVPHDSEEGIPIQTKVAREPDGGDRKAIPVRDHYGRHAFLGANPLVLAMLRDAGPQLRPDVPAAAFDAAIARTRAFISSKSAKLRLAAADSGPDELQIDVEIENLTGHKLPGGHPTRRMWLQVAVLDEAGQVRWLSGGHDSQGRLIDGNGNPLPAEAVGGPLLPHRDRVESAQQVQVYEVALADTKGQRTFSLKRGASRLKDNRIMAPGWRKDGPYAAEIVPTGVADDADHGPGLDRVRVVIALPAAARHQVRARLLFQPLSPRWAAELLQVDALDVRRFKALYEAADRGPELFAEATLLLP